MSTGDDDGGAAAGSNSSRGASLALTARGGSPAEGRRGVKKCDVEDEALTLVVKAFSDDSDDHPLRERFPLCEDPLKMYIRLLDLKPRELAAIFASCGVNLFLEALTSGGGDDKTEQSVRSALNRARAPLKNPAKLGKVKEKIDEAMARASRRVLRENRVDG